MNDNYFHQDHNFIYTPENIPGPMENSSDYLQIVEDFNSQLTSNCQCDNTCIPPGCSCVNQSGRNYFNTPQSEEYAYLLNDNKMEDNVICPILECNDLCSCSVYCGNRLVQRGPLKTLYIGNCQNTSKGLGLFTYNFIYKGTFVCEYAGEVITRTEANIRHQNNTLKGEMNYIFCLNEHSKNGTTQTFVDPSKFGNIGRYANHSCDPNCVIVPVRVNTPIPRLALFACSNISPQSEITFNYESHNNDSDLQLEHVIRKRCLCGTIKCKEWMPYQTF